VFAVLWQTVITLTVILSTFEGSGVLQNMLSNILLSAGFKEATENALGGELNVYITKFILSNPDN
jgi:hypothetical protein